MTITVRLDAATEAWLRRRARKEGRTRSEVVRQALRDLAIKEETPHGVKPAEAIAHLIGCVRGGPPDLSSRTGEKFRLLLQRKRRRR